MGSVVGGYHHACDEQVLDARGANGPVRDAVCAAIFDLVSRRAVVEAIRHYVVIEVPALEDVFMCNVVVACDEPAPADVERRACPGHERLFAAGDIFPEQLHRFGLALSYLKLGEVAKAINTFSKLVEVDPAYLNAYYYMAVKSNELKKYDETLRYAREALNYVTDNNMRYSLLSIMGRIYYRQKKDYQNAIETYTKALPLAPAQSKMIVLLFRGLSHYDLGQRMDYSNDEDADMDELIDQGKMTTRRAGQASGYYEKALLDLNKVTGRYAKNAKAHINNIAQLKRRLEKIKQQIAYYEKTK